MHTATGLPPAVGPTDGRQRSVPPQTGGRHWASRLRLTHGRRDLRLKLLSLVLLSALGPVLLVGSASYLVAHGILAEKVASQLEVQASWGSDRISGFLEHRASEAAVFSEAVMVARSLRVWGWDRAGGQQGTAGEARDRLTQYLEQISDRYAAYSTLAVFDSAGRPVADVSSSGKPVAEVAAALDSAGRDRLLLRDGRRVHFAIRQPVLSGEAGPLGYLLAVCDLDDLWAELAGGPYPDSYRLKIVDSDGLALFETRSGQPTEAAAGGGLEVLGAERSLDAVAAAILVETDRATAFAPIYRLRDFALWVGLVATLVVIAIGFGLAVSMTRPIEALIAGAKAATRGDLSQEIPVASRDQIGYLTEVFNRMIRTVRDSRERLELLSNTDALTGLANRRVLDARFENELERARRLGDPLSVLMIDLDRFKAFNDRHGHQAGDAVLHFVGDFLGRCLRSIDIAARYGGEEFLVLLPSTDCEGARELAERLRCSFKRAYDEVELATPPVTLSLGVAAYPRNGRTAEELVCAADSALYAAKRAGRDRVSVAGTEPRLRVVAPAARGSRL